MPNFTITRKTEPSDDYGCTDFETNQISGDAASLINGDPLDGSIIWYLDANAGYTVDVADFNIPNTTPTTALQTPIYRTFEGAGVPPPVLGIVFEKITATRIKITLFLHPNALHGITGAIFVMPLNSVTANVIIEGCAVISGREVNVEVNEDGEIGDVDVEVEVRDPFIETLTVDESAEGTTTISGFVNMDAENEGLPLFSYTMTAARGTRFTSTPQFNISTGDHYTDYSSTEDSDGNIVSATIQVYLR